MIKNSVSDSLVESVGNIVAPFKSVPGGLLPALWAVQNEHGFVASDAVPTIADTLNLSRAEVHGVLSFYHHFRTQAPARHVVQICRAEACQAMGARGLESLAKSIVGAEFDEHREGHDIELESAYCLGLCSCAPAIAVDGELKARVSEQDLRDTLAKLSSNAAVDA